MIWKRPTLSTWIFKLLVKWLGVMHIRWVNTVFNLILDYRIDTLRPASSLYEENSRINQIVTRVGRLVAEEDSKHLKRNSETVQLIHLQISTDISDKDIKHQIVTLLRLLQPAWHGCSPKASAREKTSTKSTHIACSIQSTKQFCVLIHCLVWSIIIRRQLGKNQTHHRQSRNCG